MNGTTKLTPHFTEEEFRCPCCGRVIVDPTLVAILEKARVAYGKSIIIESGFRCEKHNKAVKGVPGSSHLVGQAVDIRCYLAVDRYTLLKIFLTLGINRIGIGRVFLHVDVSETLPQNCIWSYGDF